MSGSFHFSFFGHSDRETKKISCHFQPKCGFFYTENGHFEQKTKNGMNPTQHNLLLKYGSEEMGSSLCKCSILMGFFMSKKLERIRSELLSEDKITNLLGFLTK